MTRRTSRVGGGRVTGSVISVEEKTRILFCGKGIRKNMYKYTANSYLFMMLYSSSDGDGINGYQQLEENKTFNAHGLPF